MLARVKIKKLAKLIARSKSVFGLREQIEAANTARRSGDHIHHMLVSAFVRREFTAVYSSVAGVALILAIAASMHSALAFAWAAAFRTGSLAFNYAMAWRVLQALRGKKDFSRDLALLTFGAGLAAFSWGALLWPLAITQANSMSTFVIFVAVMIAVSLQAITSAFYRPALYAVFAGAILAIGPKFYAIFDAVGFGLPLGSMVLLGILFAYARLNEAQTRGMIALQVKNRRISQRLQEANDRIQQALEIATLHAQRDSLTGLRNRRAFLQHTEEVLDSFEGSGSHYLCLLDIDHFKRINDNYGHHTGDAVLKSVAQILSDVEEIGEVSVTGRWGGEEFILLLEAENPIHAQARMEYVRRQIGLAHRMQQDWPEGLVVNASAGACAIAPGDTIDDALIAADAQLYCAKDTGRDRLKMAA